MSARSVRAQRAAAALSALRACWPNHPEHAPARLDDWLGLATGAEVRRHWRDHFGALPPWAVAS